MKLISDKELAIFFAESPLYAKVQLLDTLDENIDLNLYDFLDGKAYKFYCPHDKDYHTFKMNKKWGQQFTFYEPEIPESLLDKQQLLNFSFHTSATCQFCGLKVDFLLNVFTTLERKLNEPYPAVFLRKIGQFPASERKPENDVFNYLTQDDKEFYKKAMANLSVGNGIGAYAYFRRIVENEIKSLVKDISELEYENVDKVKIAWEEYQINHNMTSLIDSISSFLPKSLKEIGDNPLKVLYQQSSGGIHEFSEDECLDKSRDIDKLLQYIIKRMSSLKFEYKEAKEAMKNLSK